LNGETYVISVNEFSATCNWQVVGVQVEQNWCKDRTLKKAVTLGSSRTGVIAHVHPERSISKQQTHQSGKPILHAFTQFVKKTSVPDTVDSTFLPAVMEADIVQNHNFYTLPALDPPLILIVLSRLDKGIQSGIEMLPLKRRWGVAHF